VLNPDGTYDRIIQTAGETACRSQHELLNHADAPADVVPLAEVRWNGPTSKKKSKSKSASA